MFARSVYGWQRPLFCMLKSPEFWTFFSFYFSYVNSTFLVFKNKMAIFVASFLMKISILFLYQICFRGVKFIVICFWGLKASLILCQIFLFEKRFHFLFCFYVIFYPIHLFRDIKMRNWKLVSQQYRAWSVCTEVQAGLALYWWQKLSPIKLSPSVPE